MFLRVLIVLSLVFAGGLTASAQGQAGAVASAERRTRALELEVKRVQGELAKHARATAKLKAQYTRQLSAIDALKRQRSSWRRDRQLKAAYADSQSTAKRLATTDGRRRKASRRLRGSRSKLYKAAKAELALAVSAGRRADLNRLLSKRKRNSQGRRRIVLPDERIDPLASPDELEEQAQLLAKSERQLALEIQSLARREKRYVRMAKLRRTRARATEISLLDDNSPRRTTGRTASTAAAGAGGRGSDSANEGASEPPPPDAEPAPGGTTGADDGAFEGAGSGSPSDADTADYSIILADVVDSPTLRAYRSADVSGDPAKKASAAKRMRRKAKERLERLRQRRKQMQEKARRLRKR